MRMMGMSSEVTVETADHEAVSRGEKSAAAPDCMATESSARSDDLFGTLSVPSPEEDAKQDNNNAAQDADCNDIVPSEEFGGNVANMAAQRPENNESSSDAKEIVAEEEEQEEISSYEKTLVQVDANSPSTAAADNDEYSQIQNGGYDQPMSEQAQNVPAVTNDAEQKSQPELHSQESIIASQSMALNDAFMALENMRKANLELELADVANGKVDHRCCTQCLRDQYAKERQRVQEGKKRRSWKSSFSRRRTALPCLVCASPVCTIHSSPEFRKDKVSICGDCAPLFGIDFIFDIVFNEDRAHRQACIAKVVDSYDRAVLIIKYSSQFIDDIAKALHENTERDNKVGLGSSGVGLVSGITGAAAAAVHIAAAAAAGAAILSPAGPPLFIASLIFGGTAAAASTGTEAVSYYSEPNQMANRIMALHELINSLLQVTVILKDALVNGRINLDHYVDRKQKKKTKNDKKKGKAKSSSSEADPQAGDDIDTTEKVASDVEQDAATEVEEVEDDASFISDAQTDITESGDESAFEESNEKYSAATGSDQLQAAASALSLDESVSVGEAVKAGEQEHTSLNAASSLEESFHNDGLATEVSDAAGEQTTEEPKGSKVKGGTNSGDKDKDAAEEPSKSSSSTTSNEKAPAATKEGTKIVAQQDNVTSAICRATTNVMKAASAASAACGVLSVTTIILEAKNMTDSLERMKAGNKCEKADIILAIKAEVDKLPDTSMIAQECESYLKGKTAVEAQPAALTLRQSKEAQECGATRRGLPIKLDG